jgi:hypothetical protein
VGCYDLSIGLPIEVAIGGAILSAQTVQSHSFRGWYLTALVSSKSWEKEALKQRKSPCDPSPEAVIAHR